MRDRLRAVECPSDIIDKIGGQITAVVGQSYGQGFPLEVISKWMNKIQCGLSHQLPVTHKMLTVQFVSMR